MRVNEPGPRMTHAKSGVERGQFAYGLTVIVPVIAAPWTVQK
jgi:hypothetical protein